ncbi:hypothetical protein [Bradyrhizobium sp. CCBAU 11357]|uniref:hypothetical protein n=1 Tax=Bradyrhizobium sp. CCBAU 11357 TaxID=1630808 RepID=UPI002304A667|nr:hypothetical protein [Bradyrhizobium sp. CCBAU 11357]
MAALLAGLLASPSQAAELITAVEAKQAPPRGAVIDDQRGILRGPKIALNSPADTTPSPLRLHLTFQSFGGTKIDPESIRVTLLRSPNVDLTPRIKPFTLATGIDMPNAEAPPGEYLLRIDLKDTDGHPGTTIIVLRVSP